MSPAMAMSTVAQPERIGEYRIVRQLSATPTSVSYFGIHLVLPRRAVVKVMTATTPQIAVRVLREAYFLEALQHPGVVRCYESALLPDKRPWFARELVEGPMLASRFEPGALDRGEAIAIVRDLAEILQHAHQRGIVHGNLRADRIVITGRSRNYPLCIVDWSDARTHDAAPLPYVPSPVSWHYTAPEVVHGHGVDDRADVYALGVNAYQLLTGVMPYARGAEMATARTPHVPVQTRCPDAPRELAAIVDRMLSQDPFDRPTSAEVCADLDWLLGGDDVAPVRIRKPRWTPPIKFESTEFVPEEFEGAPTKHR